MRVAIEVARGNDFSVTLTPENFAKHMNFLPASPELWAGREGPLSMDETKMRQSKLGELCSVATASRPDVCARSARIFSRANSLRGGDVYRINEPARAAGEWQKATALTYASTSHLRKRLWFDGKAEEALCRSGRNWHCGTLSLGAWSDAACEDQYTEGKCRLGSVVGSMSSSLTGPRHVLQWTPKSAEEL